MDKWKTKMLASGRCVRCGEPREQLDKQSCDKCLAQMKKDVEERERKKPNAKKYVDSVMQYLDWRDS